MHKALLLSRAAEAFGEARNAKAAANVNLIKVFESFPLVEGGRRRILRTRLYDRLLGKRLRLECTVNEGSADAGRNRSGWTTNRWMSIVASQKRHEIAPISSPS